MRAGDPSIPDPPAAGGGWLRPIGAALLGSAVGVLVSSAATGAIQPAALWATLPATLLTAALAFGRVLPRARPAVATGRAPAPVLDHRSWLALFRDLPGSALVMDRDLRHVAVTEQFLREHHLGPGDSILGRHHYEVFPGLPEGARELHRRALAGESFVSPRQYLMDRRAEGDRSFFGLKPWHTPAGDIGGIVLSRAEVAEVDEARTEARIAADHLKLFYDLIPHSLWTADAEGRLLDIGQTFLNETGLSLAELKADPELRTWVHPDDQAHVMEAYRRSIETGQATDVRHRHRLRDGSYRWYRVRAFPQHDEQGRILRWFGVTEDVDDQTRAELKRQESEQRFQRIFEASPIGIALRRADSLQIIQANEAFCQMLGYSAAELVGLPTHRILAPDEPWIELSDLLSHERHELKVERRLLTKAGQTRWARLSATLLEGPAGEPPILLGFFEDVTEQKHAEASLRQAQKMEAIGQLTGGVAHDFNNILAIIQGNIELVSRRLGGEAPAGELLADALRAARRGAALTQQLLAYARRQPLMPRTIDIAQLVGDIGALFKRTLGETVELVTAVPDTLWLTRVDPNFLENALLNLAVNARDAMPQGGKLTIEAHNAVLDQAYAEQNADAVPGAYVAVSVSDTGVGIPKELLDRVLEPFFTTKPVGQGSGLGLSMVYGFVKQSHGHLKIYSEPGHGTTVTLYLPRTTAEGAALEPSESGDPAPRSPAGEVVLVVEDDPLVRKLAVRLLDQLGYGTLEAGDGPAALALLDAGHRVDLILTDVVLPKGMNGPALAREALARRPAVGIVYMSGYTQNAIVHNGVLDAGAELLRKPFLLAELAEKISRVLTGGRTP